VGAHLFVYGTLRRGFDNPFARLLAQSSHYVGPGYVQGVLYSMGEYPALVLANDGAHQVRGDVYELNDAESTLRILDEYEGPQYPRVTVAVSIPGAPQPLDAWVYICTHDTSGRPRIESGDFLAYRSS
jgi:gamma-glutamylcyclotransferase (GGCT)/AIG2-like uncharacterized protein YtfP